MRDGWTLGVDIGTSATKALVLDPERGAVGHGSSAYAVELPAPGRAEQDPRAWWAAVVEACRAALDDAGPGAAERVRALAVSGQGAALVLLDNGGEPVRPALLHLDQRADAEARDLASGAAGAAVAEASGNTVGAWNAAAKLTWVRRHEPEAFSRARTATSAAGYVLGRLVGRPVASASDAGISDLFALGARDWSAEVLAAVGVRRTLLPDVAAATERVGELDGPTAAELGLDRGVAVVAGGEDTSSAALAAGVLHAGDGYLSLGTAGVVGLAVARGSVRQPRLLSFPHVRDDLDLLSGSMTSAGAAVAWLAGVVGADVPTLLAEAAEEPVGAGDVTFLPYLAGELHPVGDPTARGVFAGLSLGTTRGQLARAVLEGSAGAVAHNLTVARESGAVPARLSATGRPTGSAAWMRSVADATGLPVDVVAGDGAPFGDALLAAAENDGELDGLVSAHRRVAASYDPDQHAHVAALERRERSARLYAATSAEERTSSA